MSLVFEVIAVLLLVFWLLLLARLVFDLVQAFARDWRPRGPLVLLLEVIYTITDPPLKLLRRIIPPLRLGQVLPLQSRLFLVEPADIVQGLGGQHRSQPVM